MAQQELTERELRAWWTSMHMMEILRGRIEQELQACSGLSNADYSVLSLLSEAPETRMRIYELARTAGWEKSRMHHQLTRMSKRSLVERERCGSRGMEAVLTPVGLDALKSAVPSHTQEVRRLFVDCLTAEELDRFADISGTILENMQSKQ